MKVFEESSLFFLYLQVDVFVSGSPIWPVLSNMFMTDLEKSITAELAKNIKY